MFNAEWVPDKPVFLVKFNGAPKAEEWHTYASTYANAIRSTAEAGQRCLVVFDCRDLVIELPTFLYFVMSKARLAAYLKRWTMVAVTAVLVLTTSPRVATIVRRIAAMNGQSAPFYVFYNKPELVTRARDLVGLMTHGLWVDGGGGTRPGLPCRGLSRVGVVAVIGMLLRKAAHARLAHDEANRSAMTWDF